MNLRRITANFRRQDWTARSHPNVVPYLRLRIADIETRLGDLTSNNSDIMENVHAVAGEKP